MILSRRRSLTSRGIDGHRYLALQDWPLSEREAARLKQAENVHVDEVGLPALEYLTDCAQMRRLIVTDSAVRDVSSLNHHATRLVELDLFVGPVRERNSVTTLPILRRLCMRWSPGLSQLMETRALRHLMIESPTRQALDIMADGDGLEVLDLRGPRTQLRSASFPRHLQVLRLADAIMLDDPMSASTLPQQLKVLELDRVRGFGDLRRLRSLDCLQRLVLEESGPHEHWAALLDLKQLREVIVIGRHDMSADVAKVLKERKVRVKRPPG